jgi:hypothetical protein
VKFNTYYVNTTDPACKGFVGASFPPLLTVGWCGKAYLNDQKGLGKKGTLELAAYGKSFVATACPKHRQLVRKEQKGETSLVNEIKDLNQQSGLGKNGTLELSTFEKSFKATPSEKDTLHRKLRGLTG